MIARIKIEGLSEVEEAAKEMLEHIEAIKALSGKTSRILATVAFGDDEETASGN